IGDAEGMVDAVRILKRHPLPRARRVQLRRIGVGGAGDVTARVVVIEHAEVHAPVVVERVPVAAIEVPLQAATVLTNAGVMKPTDIRTPRAKIEATLVSEVEAPLKRRLVVGLREAAEDVLTVNAEVSGQRIVGLGFGGFRRGGGCRGGRGLCNRSA